MIDATVREAAPEDLAWSLRWSEVGAFLNGELIARNITERDTVRLSAKPGLKLLDAAGDALPVPCLATAEFMPPGYLDLDPGRSAKSLASWSGGTGGVPSGRFLISWLGGEVEVAASGPTTPPGWGSTGNITTGWFGPVDEND